MSTVTVHVPPPAMVPALKLTDAARRPAPRSPRRSRWWSRSARRQRHRRRRHGNVSLNATPVSAVAPFGW